MPPARPLAAPPHEPEHGGAGRLALAALLVIVLATLVVLVRTCTASEPPTSTAVGRITPEPARPLSGAPAGQPATPATVVPTLAPPERSAPPTARPTVQPTRQPTQQPTPQPTPPPTRPAPAAGSPVDTIRQHYALIDARRYAEGYALMDARLRRLNSPADYAGWFANKVSITPVSVDLVSQTDTQAVVRSVVQTTDKVDGRDVTRQVSEQFVLRQEDGALAQRPGRSSRLRPRGLQSPSPRVAREERMGPELSREVFGPPSSRRVGMAGPTPRSRTSSGARGGPPERPAGPEHRGRHIAASTRDLIRQADPLPAGRTAVIAVCHPRPAHSLRREPREVPRRRAHRRRTGGPDGCLTCSFGY